MVGIGNRPCAHTGIGDGSGNRGSTCGGILTIATDGHIPDVQAISGGAGAGTIAVVSGFGVQTITPTANGMADSVATVRIFRTQAGAIKTTANTIFSTGCVQADSGAAVVTVTVQGSACIQSVRAGAADAVAVVGVVCIHADATVTGAVAVIGGAVGQHTFAADADANAIRGGEIGDNGRISGLRL